MATVGALSILKHERGQWALTPSPIKTETIHHIPPALICPALISRNGSFHSNSFYYSTLIGLATNLLAIIDRLRILTNSTLSEAACRSQVLESFDFTSAAQKEPVILMRIFNNASCRTAKRCLSCFDRKGV